jgi:hypothetical protein
MGVTSVLARWASANVHVLIVEVPGGDQLRMLLETELDRRGWTVALSPADADLFAVCGVPGKELRAASDFLWNQMPGPRSRVAVTTELALPALLDAAVAHLVDDSLQRAEARARSRSTAAETPKSHIQEHESVSHEGMDHGDMDMQGPGGIPLAGGGDDRDGLEMDVLNVPLGPLLPHWPAGLVVDCVLQGDVIVSAQARILDAPFAPGCAPNKESSQVKMPDEDAHQRTVRLCDHASNVLALAGWQTAAQEARRLRNDLLSNDVPQEAHATNSATAIDRLRRRVERSMLLRWSLKDLSLRGTGSGADANPLTPNPAGYGDVRNRLVGWLTEASTLTGTPSAQQSPVASLSDRAQGAQRALAALPELLVGTDLGTARLLIAGLGLDIAALVRAHERAHD